MNNFYRYIEYLFGLPKSIYFCFKYFPLKVALKLPVFISSKVVLNSVKGKVILQTDHIRTGMIKIGFGYVGIFDKDVSRSMYENSGTIVFRGGTSVGHGSKISVGKDAIIDFGDNFTVTAESQICSQKKIKFGDNVLISWDCLIMDTDWHKIIKNGKQINNNKEISIGNNVWIGCRTTILKGVNIPNGCVVAANSNVVKSIHEARCIIAGNPAKKVKDDIQWKS